MTPKRKAALKWFFDNPGRDHTEAVSFVMIDRMKSAGEVEAKKGYFNRYILADLGRRRLHGDDV